MRNSSKAFTTEQNLKYPEIEPSHPVQIFKNIVELNFGKVSEIDELTLIIL